MLGPDIPNIVYLDPGPCMSEPYICTGIKLYLKIHLQNHRPTQSIQKCARRKRLHQSERHVELA